MPDIEDFKSRLLLLPRVAWVDYGGAKIGFRVGITPGPIMDLNVDIERTLKGSGLGYVLSNKARPAS